MGLRKGSRPATGAPAVPASLSLQGLTDRVKNICDQNIGDCKWGVFGCDCEGRYLNNVLIGYFTVSYASFPVSFRLDPVEYANFFGVLQVVITSVQSLLVM